jgi:hypothetical protein
MRYTIGIYASNDWAGARAYADQLRAEEPCTVRIRDGGLFTLDQREAFDVVFVKGDFPLVMEAYPDAHQVDEFPAAAARNPDELDPAADQAQASDEE